LGTIVSGAFVFFFHSTVVKVLLIVKRPLPWRTLSAQDRLSGICLQGQSSGEGLLVGAGGFWLWGGAVGPGCWEPLFIGVWEVVTTEVLSR
jgi:hypothetical protein